MKNDGVTLYIPVYNGEKYIRKCLEGILKQTYPISRLFVIDDGSTDDSAGIASELGVEVIKQPGNKGLSHARHRAVLEAKTPLIASLDVDCVPEPDWLEKLVESVSSPGVAGAGGKLVEYFHQDIADRWRALHMVQNWGDHPRVSPLFLSGSNNIFHKEALLIAGNYPLDPKYKTNGEDLYMSLTLKSLGFKIVYNPSAIVFHHRRDSIASIIRTYWKWHFPNLPQPDSLQNLWIKVKDTIYRAEIDIRKDLRHRDWRLFLLTLFNLFYQTTLDFEFFLNHHRVTSCPVA